MYIFENIRLELSLPYTLPELDDLSTVFYLKKAQSQNKDIFGSKDSSGNNCKMLVNLLNFSDSKLETA